MGRGGGEGREQEMFVEGKYVQTKGRGGGRGLSRQLWIIISIITDATVTCQWPCAAATDVSGVPSSLRVFALPPAASRLLTISCCPAHRSRAVSSDKALARHLPTQPDRAP